MKRTRYRRQNFEQVYQSAKTGAERARARAQREWQALEIRDPGALKTFPGEYSFLKFLFTEERPLRWRDPQKMFSPHTVEQKKAAQRRVRMMAQDLHRKKRLKLFRTLGKIWHGRPIEHPSRWFWVSALVPYMRWKNGNVDWVWLARWSELIDSPGNVQTDMADRVRKWWRYSVDAIALDVEAVSPLAERLAKDSRDVAARENLTGHFTRAAYLDGVWSYVRFARERTRPRPVGDITELVGEGLIARTDSERDYLKRGVLKEFPFFKATKVRESDYKDYADWLGVEACPPIPPGYLRLAPRVQHAGLKSRR